VTPVFLQACTALLNPVPRERSAIMRAPGESGASPQYPAANALGAGKHISELLGILGFHSRKGKQTAALRIAVPS